LITSIKPPLADDEFRSNLDVLIKNFGEQLRSTVRQHLDKQLTTKETEAGRLNRVDIDRARQVAHKYIANTLGRRLPHDSINRMLDRAVTKVGHDKAPPSRPVVPNTEWTTISPRHPKTGTNADAARKRSAPSPSPTAISNRFQYLEAEDISDAEDVEPTTPPPTPSKKKQRQVTPQGQTTVKTYRGPKNEWTIQPEPPTYCIVIGDSNLRNITEVPEGWEVHSLPGAHLKDLTEAALTLDPDKQHDHSINVIVQAGINHRDRFDDVTKKEMDDLIEALCDSTAVGRVYFAGVSIPRSLPANEVDNIRAFNKYAKQVLPSGRYLEPIPDDEVEIVANDHYGIHHSAKTANYILASIVSDTSLDF
jgi:hypothetical protein